MAFIFNKIKNSIMSDELTHNFKECESIKEYCDNLFLFLFPTKEDLKPFSYRPTFFYKGDQRFPIDIGKTTNTIEYMNNYTYNIHYEGTVKPLSQATKQQIGFLKSTHANVTLIRIPTNDYTQIKLNNNPIQDEDIFLYNGTPFLVVVNGLYKENGETKTENPTQKISYGNFSITHNFDFSKVTF